MVIHIYNFFLFHILSHYGNHGRGWGRSWEFLLFAFELWCWRRLLRVSWTARRSNQSILKEINLEYSLEELMLKLPYFSHRCKEPTHWKRPWCWERLNAGREGGDRKWDDWIASVINGHEFKQIPGDSERKGRLACCSPWNRKESDTT